MFGSVSKQPQPEEPKEEVKPAGNILDPRLDENVRVVQWRTEQLADAGFRIKYAVKIAQARAVDYHRAIDLLRRLEGDDELAVRILLGSVAA